MADALAELLDHHMNEGLLPRRKGVRPHVSLTTTLPGLKRHFHHRLVHEGEWQIVKAGDEFHVIPPEALRSIFVRGPDVTWAA